MIGTTLLANALRLPCEDWQALTQGKAIAALPWNFITPGQSFALFPISPNAIENVKVRFWAKCELCQSIDNASAVNILSKLTTWTEQTLQSKLEERGFFFLAFLRVYELPQPAEVVLSAKGDFLPLLEPMMISNPIPVLSNKIFAQRKRRLENLEPPEHPEIEAVHDAIAQLSPTNPKAIHLEQDLKYFLGWAESAIVNRADSDWVQEIAQVGNSSDGDHFEKLVRKSFIKLGFSNSLNNFKASLDPAASGGAGGIDIYCDAPYSLVGECKASRHENVPNGVSAQLINLGTTHLGKAVFERSIKILFVAGRLTNAAEKAAVENQMNVMRPETLERLVTLKATYPGAINLIELKACLEIAPFGEASNQKVNIYLDHIQQELQVRSRIIQLLQAKSPQQLGIDFIWGTYEALNPPRSLTKEELKDILIELSSPLTGFIGRKNGDRFYFLRPLNLDPES